MKNYKEKYKVLKREFDDLQKLSKIQEKVIEQATAAIIAFKEKYELQPIPFKKADIGFEQRYPHRVID